MNRKKMPLILMLVAGAVAWIIAFVQQYTVLDSLLAVLASLVIFFMLGNIMKWILNYFDSQNEKLAEEQLAEEIGEAQEAEEEQTQEA